MQQHSPARVTSFPDAYLSAPDRCTPNQAAVNMMNDNKLMDALIKGHERKRRANSAPLFVSLMAKTNQAGFSSVPTSSASSSAAASGSSAAASSPVMAG